MSDTPSRIPIGKSVRFEVFKRDKFTCQYCGASAPEVLLHVDHIQPVAEGGGNDLLNLITSCVACNLGKGARTLSDNSAVEKQRRMLEDLEERRQQLTLMLQWRDELQQQKTDVVDEIEQRIHQRTGYSLNEAGKANLRRWLKNYTTPEIMRAIDEAFDTYLVFTRDEIDADSWERAFAKVPGIASTLRQMEERPYIRDLFYIQGIIRKRARAPRYKCIEYLEHVHLCGMSIDEIKNRARRMNALDDFEGPLDEWLREMGRPF